MFALNLSFTVLQAQDSVDDLKNQHFAHDGGVQWHENDAAGSNWSSDRASASQVDAGGSEAVPSVASSTPRRDYSKFSRRV